MSETGTERTLERWERLKAAYCIGERGSEKAIDAYVRHLEAQVERYREDGERLDWLETQPLDIQGEYGVGWRIDGLPYNNDDLHIEAVTLREAIDAARKETP